jgi:hypothetical protein
VPEIPAPYPHTVERVYAALAKAAGGGDSAGVSMSQAINECERATWYALHWCAPPKPFDGPGASRLATGEDWERRLIDDLAKIGIMFDHHQERVTLANGWLRVRCDATGIGFLEAPKTEHVIEAKSLKAEKFRAVVKHGVAKAIPDHYAQCQLYAHALSLTRIAYWCVNKDTDERHLERIEYDPVFCMGIEARVERIAEMQEPPARLHDNPHAKSAFQCGYCPALAICHEGAFARVNCRTCAHATLGPESLMCIRDLSERKYKDQQSGCRDHRYLPGLVPGEQIDVREGDLIVYRLRDGREWIDGDGKKSKC